MMRRIKILKFGMKIILFVLLFLIVNRIFRFLIIDDKDSYTRIMFHEMYEQENIDVLFLGSSHCYRSVNLEIFDKEWGVNTFNAGTSSQQADGSYYLLREVGANNNIKRVYLEVYYDILRENENYRLPTASYIISDYMKPSLNRFEYLWESGGSDHLVHGFILPRRNWNKFFDYSYLKDNIRNKLNKSYLNYEYIDSGNEFYAGKGYVYSNDIIEQGNFFANACYAPIQESSISSKNKEYLNKIIDYCNKREIELIFYSAPVPDFRLINVGNYDLYILQMQELIKDYNVTYYDFNLCKPEWLAMENIDFKDDHHLNGMGADKFSEAFLHIMALENPEDAFYKSYELKVQDHTETLYGIICEFIGEVDGEKKYYINPVTNKEYPLYYSVYKHTDEEKEYSVLNNFSEEREFVIPAEESGYIKIYAASDSYGENIISECKFAY